MIHVQNLTTNLVEVASTAGTLWLAPSQAVWITGRTSSVVSASVTHSVGHPDMAFSACLVGSSGAASYSLDWLWQVPLTLFVTWVMWKLIFRMVSWIGGHFGPGPLD